MWLAVNILLLVVLCCLQLRLLSDTPGWARYAVVGLTILAPPVIVTLLQGQLSFVLMIGLLAGLSFLRAGEDLKGGIWLGILLVKPQLIVLPLLVILLQRRWRALSGFALTTAALFLVSVMVVGWTGMLRWLDLLLAAPGWGEAYGVHPQRMYTLRGILYHFPGLADAGDVLTWWALGVAIAVLPLLWHWRRRDAGEGTRFDIQAAALVVTMVFASPHAYFHDLSLLLLSVGFLVRYASTGRGSTRQYQLPV